MPSVLHSGSNMCFVRDNWKAYDILQLAKVRFILPLCDAAMCTMYRKQKQHKEKYITSLENCGLVNLANLQ